MSMDSMYGAPLMDPVLPPPTVGSISDPSPRAMGAAQAQAAQQQASMDHAAAIAQAQAMAAAQQAVQQQAHLYAQPAAAAAQPTAAAAARSFSDRLAAKRGEVWRMALLALVVVLALATHDMLSHYLNAYLADAFLSPGHEVLVRIGYPVAVLLFAWVAKAW